MLIFQPQASPICYTFLVTSLIGDPEGGVGPLAKPGSLEEVEGRRPGGRQRLTPGVGDMKTMQWSMTTFDPHCWGTS